MTRYSRLSSTGLVAFCFLPALSAAQRPRQVVPKPVPAATLADSIATPRSSQRQTPNRRPRLRFTSDFTNVYDSNVEHDSTNIGSYGIVGGARARFRTRSSRPAFHAEYAVAAHSYTATDKWDRISHLGRVGFDIPLGDRLLVGLIGEGALKGSSEDREIGDQAAIIPRLEIRPWDDVRVRLIGAYRKRYFGEASGANATNRYATVDTRIRFSSGTLEGTARFEENRPRTERNRFRRFTYSSAYTWPVGDRNEFVAGLEYRPVWYPERDVDIIIIDEDGEEDEIEVPRRDVRWKPELGWMRDWTRNLRTELEYEYEMRTSNDPEKKYRGHVITFTTLWSW
jgi:hypothetical protein